MINALKTCVSPFYINIFNVDSDAKHDQILQYYNGFKIKELIKNQHKKGNYDVVFT